MNLSPEKHAKRRQAASTARRAVDTVLESCYTLCMATWHVTVKPDVGCNSTFQGAIHALVIKPFQTRFELEGFRVQPMPNEHATTITVSHADERSMTLFLLKYTVDDLEIERIS